MRREPSASQSSRPRQARSRQGARRRRELDRSAGELEQVRDERRSLMAAVADMPTTSGEFDARDAAGRSAVERGLPDAHGPEPRDRSAAGDRERAPPDAPGRRAEGGRAGSGHRSRASRRRSTQNEHDLQALPRSEAERFASRSSSAAPRLGSATDATRRIATARKQVPRAARYAKCQLVVSGQAGTKAQSYGQRVQPLLMQARSEEDKLAAAFTALDDQVKRRAQDLQARIQKERRSSRATTGELEPLDNGTRRRARAGR